MKIDTIFLDMDGVLVDWSNAALIACGLHPNSPEVKAKMTGKWNDVLQLVTQEELDKAVNDSGVSFWTALKKFPWTDKLIEFAINRVGKDNVVFLTKCGKFPYAPTGKYLWWKNNYPELKCVLTSDKYLLAKPNTILIDDDERQIKRFSEAGGAVYEWASQYSLLAKPEDETWNEELWLLTNLMNVL